MQDSGDPEHTSSGEPEGKVQDHSRGKAALRRGRARSQPEETQGGLFVVEIALREREIQERKMDPLIRERRKGMLVLHCRGLWLHLAHQFMARRTKATWTIRNNEDLAEQATGRHEAMLGKERHRLSERTKSRGGVPGIIDSGNQAYQPRLTGLPLISVKRRGVMG